MAAVDRLQEAVETADEAVGAYRSLVGQDPATHLPDLARELLFSSLLCVHRRLDLNQALASIEESVGIYQGLVEHQPEIFNPNLQRALATRAAILEAIGLSSKN